ncbi:hypothetical protein F5Y17DRAFT_420763 [Xylariaceae sp. FL0594]|nr:hypothetical protein F5Y17DRAFT_420763 [Xylariaceae sp. FL0594]
MRTTRYSFSLAFVTFLLFCLAGFEHASALRIPSFSQVHSGTPVNRRLPRPNVGSSTDPSQASRSYLRRLLDQVSLSSSRYASSASSPVHWTESRPKLVESLKHYEDQVVVRFNITDSQQEAALRTVVDRMLLDVWDFTDNHVDIRLPSRRIRYLIRALPSSLQESQAILIPDLARLAAATYPSDQSRNEPNRQQGRGTHSAHEALSRRQDAIDVFFQNYQPYSVLLAWMRLVDSMFRGRGLVQMISLGTSYEGRDIPALRVGMRPDNDVVGSRRRVILVTGGAHAREWISTSSVNYAAWSFIRSIDRDPLVNKILERFDLVFAPVLNPDGYEYTWEVDRLWRKSRQRTKMSYCQGFDLDHSFSYQWGSAGHQTEPCSESYGGDQPFQAVEAAQLAEWAKNQTEHGYKFVGYLDLHSYSQQILVPYSFSCAVEPPNFENLEEVALNLAKHMRLSNGEVYTVASACEGAVSPPTDLGSSRIEARGGSAVDYVYHELGAHYSYQIKLRDTGSYGFLVPSNNIVPTGEEVFHAMKYLGDYLLGNNGHESAAEVTPTDGQFQQESLVDTKDKEMVVTELRKRRQVPVATDQT